MTFKPLHNFILLLPDPKAEKTAGGIIIPESAQEKDQAAVGTVVKVGDNVILNEGDRVLYYANAGTRIVFDKKDHLVLKVEENNSDVLAILT